MEEFAQRVKELRNEKQKKQMEMAELLGIKPRAVFVDVAIDRLHEASHSYSSKSAV